MYDITQPSTRPTFPTVFKSISNTDLVLGGSNSSLQPGNRPLHDLHQAIQWLKFGMIDLEAGVFTDEAKAVIAGLQASVMVSTSGSPVRMTNNTTLVLPAGLKIPDATRTSVLSVATDTNISILTTGVNGLDTGAVATDSVYYLWIIRNPTTEQVGGLLSLSATAPTMPSGFTQKQLYPVDFQTEIVSGNARLILKTLLSHQESIFNLPLVVHNDVLSSNDAAPDTLNLSTKVGVKSVAITFEFWDIPSGSLGTGQFLFYAADGSTTYPYNTASVIRLDVYADTNSSKLPVNATQTYKMCRGAGLATNIKIQSVQYAPLA